MKHPSTRTCNRGYQPKAEAAAFLNGDFSEGQSHRQEIDEIIDEYEAEQASKPLSTGDKLAILMNCSNRLHERFITCFDALRALPETDSKNRHAMLAKCQNVQKASRRVTRKITWLLEN